MQGTVKSVNKNLGNFEFVVEIDGKLFVVIKPEVATNQEINLAIRDLINDYESKNARLLDLKTNYVGRVFNG